MDFLIEIHPEDGFLGGEIRFRIWRSIDFENLNQFTFFEKKKQQTTTKKHNYLFGPPKLNLKISPLITVTAHSSIRFKFAVQTTSIKTKTVSTIQLSK